MFLYLANQQQVEKYWIKISISRESTPQRLLWRQCCVPNEHAGRVVSSDQDSPLSSWGYIYLVSLGDEQGMAGEEAQLKMTRHHTCSIECMGLGLIHCLLVSCSQKGAKEDKLLDH